MVASGVEALFFAEIIGVTLLTQNIDWPRVKPRMLGDSRKVFDGQFWR
jgi:hypothetical protein